MYEVSIFFFTAVSNKSFQFNSGSLIHCEKATSGQGVPYGEGTGSQDGLQVCTYASYLL